MLKIVICQKLLLLLVFHSLKKDAMEGKYLIHNYLRLKWQKDEIFNK